MARTTRPSARNEHLRNSNLHTQDLRTLLTVTASAALVIVGCSLLATSQQLPATQTPTDDTRTRAAAPLVPIVTVRTREYTVQIFTDQCYTVMDADDNVVAHLVSRDDLRARLPQVHAALDDAWADQAWAGTNRQPPPDFSRMPAGTTRITALP